MTLRSLRGAALLAALLAGGCQTGYYGSPSPAPVATTPMDGQWASTDGVFVANFERGRFTSRFTSTNEILAQGSYNVAGTTINMNWISVATKQQRAAACTFMAADVVACNQQGGGSFELRRGGSVMPVAAREAAPLPAPAPTPAPAPVP